MKKPLPRPFAFFRRAIMALWALPFLFSGCGTMVAPDGARPAGYAPASSAGTVSKRSSNQEAVSLATRRLPGIGTGFGESRSSSVSPADFERAGRSPDAVGRIYYNDRDGIQAALGHELGNGFRATGISATDLVSVGLRDGSGRWLRAYRKGGEVLVEGDSGSRYEIVLENKSSRRLEVVVSVDGLDVLDGKPAAVSKRGYIIPAQGVVRIEGWRTSLSRVAAFRFGSVDRSYAALKHGSTRNVGVIGFAVFKEEWRSGPVAPGGPWRPRLGDNGNDAHDEEVERDVRRRQQADPFPGGGRWATPP